MQRQNISFPAPRIVSSVFLIIHNCSKYYTKICKQLKISQPVWMCHTLQPMQERIKKTKTSWLPWTISKNFTQNVLQECNESLVFIRFLSTWPTPCPQYTAYMKSRVSRSQIYFQFADSRSRWRPYCSVIFCVFSNPLQPELRFKRQEGCLQTLPKLQHSMMREFRFC